jgi:Cu2+-exporting ATPase
MVNGIIIAAFYLVDKVRDEALVTLSDLTNSAHKTVLLSGDSQRACDTISQTLPINECMGGLSAQAKMQKIKQAQQQIAALTQKKQQLNQQP